MPSESIQQHCLLVFQACDHMIPFIANLRLQHTSSLPKLNTILDHTSSFSHPPSKRIACSFFVRVASSIIFILLLLFAALTITQLLHNILGESMVVSSQKHHILCFSQSQNVRAYILSAHTLCDPRDVSCLA